MGVLPVEVMHVGVIIVVSRARSPRPQSPHKCPAAAAAAGGSEVIVKTSDFELTFGVAQDDLMRDWVEKLTASDGSWAAGRWFIEVAFASMNHVFQIRDGSGAARSGAFLGQDRAQLLPGRGIVHIGRL